MRVALVGTGALGLASAKRLLAAGVPLVVFNRTRAAAAPLEPLGARVARDMSEVARSADCIVFSVRGARPIEEMLDAIGGAKIDGKTIVSLGLIGRRQARALDWHRVRREGGAYLNVSPCGTRREAEKGALVLVAGGSRATLRRCEPILAPLGTVLYAGDVGASATAGLAATVLSFANVTAFCHAVANLRRSGAPPEALLEALGQSAPFVNAGGFLRTYLAPSPEPVSARDRNRIRRLLRDALRGARANAVSDLRVSRRSRRAPARADRRRRALRAPRLAGGGRLPAGRGDPREEPLPARGLGLRGVRGGAANARGGGGPDGRARARNRAQPRPRRVVSPLSRGVLREALPSQFRVAPLHARRHRRRAAAAPLDAPLARRREPPSARPRAPRAIRHQSGARPGRFLRRQLRDRSPFVQRREEARPRL